MLLLKTFLYTINLTLRILKRNIYFEQKFDACVYENVCQIRINLCFKYSVLVRGHNVDLSSQLVFVMFFEVSRLSIVIYQS